MSDLLEVKNLSVSFNTPQGELKAVRNVSFSLRKGEVLALVGESGCGKSVLCKTIIEWRVKPRPIRLHTNKTYAGCCPSDISAGFIFSCIYLFSHIFVCGRLFFVIQHIL